MQVLRKTFMFGVALVLCTFFVGQPLLWAQKDTGTITGTVQDPSGAAIPKASITITNANTNVVFNTETDQTGAYMAPTLRPGEYLVTAESSGFKKATVPSVVLQVNEVATVNFKLEVGSTRQTVEVKETSPLLQTKSETEGAVIGSNLASNLPLNGRNFVELLTLTTGVTPGVPESAEESPILSSARGTTAVQINGQNDLATDFILDGIDNNETSIGGVIIFPPTDAIQEFIVQTANSSAGFGRGSGGQVNVTLKSGTNRFHGDAFEFLRNDALDARNFFDPAHIPEFRMNQFGGTLGGPIKKDRAFFFADYQGTRIVQGQSESLTVPTALMRTGDFSELGPIYDPATYDSTTNTREEFPNDTIPANRISPTATNLMNIFFPLPNRTGLSANYAFNPDRTNVTDQGDTRLDYYISEHDTLFGSESFSDSNIGETFWATTVLPNSLYRNTSPLNTDPTNEKGDITMLGETHIFSPALVNDARVGYTRFNEVSLNRLGKIQAAQLIGINNINEPSIPYSNGLPEIDISGFSSVGEVGFIPDIERVNTFEYIDTLNYIHGNHRLTFGVDARRRQFNFFQPPNERGDFYFGGVYSNQPSTVTGGSGLADMMLDLPYTSAIGVRLTSTTGQRSNEISPFMTDSWQLKPKLTLNLGLRYELVTPRVEIYNRQSNFDPNYPGGAILVASPTAPCGRGLYCTYYLPFAPRVGIAYQLNSKTVIRAAYGIFYDATGVNGYQGTQYGLFGNPPFTDTETIINTVTTPTNFMVNGFPAVPSVPTVGTKVKYVLPNAVPGVTFTSSWQDPYRKPSNAQDWNLTVEHQFTPTFLLSAAYVAAKGTDLLEHMDIDQAVPGPGAVAPRTPFPGWANINGMAAAGSSTYHSLQLQTQKRASHGLTFLASYTYAKSLGNVQINGGSVDQNYYDRSADRGPTDMDVRNNLVGSYQWQLPFGSGQRFLTSANGVTNKIVGGWIFGGIVSLYSGLPFTPALAVPTVNTGTGSYPNRICNGKLGNPTVNLWFNPSCFVTPPLYTYGNAGVNILTGPGTHEFDFSLMKDIHIDEERYFQFRGEFFNIFNTPQFNGPNATIGVPGAGEVTSEGIPANFVRTSREIQFALKFYF